MTLSIERLAAELIAVEEQNSAPAETRILRPGERVSIVGMTGPQGTLTLSGRGAPTTDARPDDLYLDTETGDLWRFN